MKKCAYCGEILGSLFHFKTDEHIIPDGLALNVCKRDNVKSIVLS